MDKFKNFIIEENEPEGKALKHLTHLEDMPIHYGHAGVETAANHLDDVNKLLSGKNSTTHVSTKYDGSPSIVFGVHPQTRQFFVASKSAFNKNPKINYTPEDIERNHGHAPGLVEKLKSALEHLPKIMPRHGGVYQGDMMYTKPDIEKSKGQYHFTPNSITYSTPKDSPQGKAIKNAEMGVVVHTKYAGGKDLGNMSAMPLDNKTRSKFSHNPDVHNIDPTLKVDPSNYTSEEQLEFMNHKDNAKRVYARMKPEALDALQGHGTTLEGHVNDMVRKSGTPSVEGYINHLQNRAQKDIEKLKSPLGREKKMQQHAANIQHVIDNKEHFGKALELHGHLQKAKDVLTNVMAKNQEFSHSINGEPTGPEGAVAVDKQGNMSKFVNRAEFSRQNLLGAGRIAQSKNLKEDVDSDHHVMTFMRANPPTAGHERVVDRVLDLASKHDASHNVILSHSHDDSKNPLNPQQKLKHARRAFPNANVMTSSEDQPSLLHHASDAYRNGAKHLHVVVGQDRVKEFENLLNRYNGKEAKHGKYNFKSITVHSAGERDPDAAGTEGISATKMRAAAKSNDTETFHAGSPSAMSAKHKNDMMKDVKRNLKEEMTTGDVRGMGYVSGNPLVSDNFQNNWTALNRADADTRDQILGANKKHLHDELHANLQQKLADKKAKIAELFYRATEGKK